MKNESKTKQQLLAELQKLRKLNKEFGNRSQHHQAEDALRESEERYKTLSELSNVEGILLHDKGVAVEVNNTFAKIFGYEADELIGKNVIDLLALPEYKNLILKNIAAGFDEPYEIMSQRKDGTIIPLMIESAKDVLYKGHLIRVLSVRDITTEKKTEEKIEHLNLILRTIRNVNQLIIKEKDYYKLIKGACENLIKTRGYFNAWITLFDDSGKYITSAEAGLGKDFLPLIELMKSGEITACGKNALKKSEVIVIENPSDECKDCPLSKKYTARGAITMRLEYHGKIYGLTSVSIPAKFLNNEQEKSLFKEVTNDIAYALHGIEVEEERKLAEEKIKTSLQEKEVMLREIHHRVKNNMQIISSLLRLQSKEIEDKIAREKFKVSQNRIKTMALIHDNLYEAKDLAKIDFSNYIEKLTTHVFSTYSQEAALINLKLELGNVYLDITRAIPCGQILNELLSNAIKHAFPAGKKGEIRIKMDISKEENFILIVGDNGVGFPKKLDFQKTETLGLQLVNDLVKQLLGTIELNRECGTTLKIKF